MTSLLYSIGIVLSLIGLLFWARRRAATIRERSAQREQEAMALLLAASGRGGATVTGDTTMLDEALPKPVGRLLEDDASEKAAAAAREAARLAREESVNRNLHPIEFESVKSPARGPTPAEEAAAGLDPIEDLISQIMVDPPFGRATPSDGGKVSSWSATASTPSRR